MFPKTKSKETSGLPGKLLFPEGPHIRGFVIYLDSPLNDHIAKTDKDGMWATTVQLYPGWDTFEFD